MITSLLLPILIAAVALFFVSFLAWMVLPIHFKDWNKIDKEDDLMKVVADLGIPTGNYMFPGWNTPQEMKSEDYNKKWEAGPCGIMTVYPKVNMGRNLGLTFVYFLIVSFCLAYLTSMAIEPGAAFMEVFRFVSTAGFLTFLAAMVLNAIWFHNRIVGHVIESIAYAAIIGVIFGLMWPGV